MRAASAQTTSKLRRDGDLASFVAGAGRRNDARARLQEGAERRRMVVVLPAGQIGEGNGLEGGAWSEPALEEPDPAAELTLAPRGIITVRPERPAERALRLPARASTRTMPVPPESRADPGIASTANWAPAWQPASSWDRARTTSRAKVQMSMTSLIRLGSPEMTAPARSRVAEISSLTNLTTTCAWLFFSSASSDIGLVDADEALVDQLAAALAVADGGREAVEHLAAEQCLRAPCGCLRQRR